MKILNARGYGVHQDRRFDVQLNVPSKTRFRKLDGLPYRELLRGLTRAEVEVVLTRAENAEAAAQWIERLSLGEEMSAQDAEMSPHGSSVSGLTAEQIATIIDSRVRLGVSRELEQPMAELAIMRAEITDLVTALRKQLDEPAKPKPKAKPGPKKGKKLDPNSPEVDAAMASLNLPTQLPPLGD